MSDQEVLKQWDEWIRQGEGTKVLSQFKMLNFKKIPRAFVTEYAQIARRIGAPELIILILRPIVRSESTKIIATAAEKAIYGLGLFRLGAFNEAERTLKEINPEDEPQVYFYLASFYINQWSYKKAIPLLKRYILSQKIPAYSKIVARLNLCAAYVSVKNYEKADIQIARLLKKLEQQKLALLTGNLLEIRSQLNYQKNNFEEALSDLNKAHQNLAKADKRSLFYVKKWQALVQLKANPNDPNSISHLMDLKNEASASKDWETVRDCDFQLAFSQNNRYLGQKVFWGSKFKSFKKRVSQDLPELSTSNESWVWSEESNSKKLFSSPFDPVSLAPTKSIKKLLFILTRELYQPLRFTEIIDALYPNEYYHPVSSPMRLQRLISRTRRWLYEIKAPIEIQSYRNSIRLEMNEDSSILILKNFPKSPQTQLPIALQNKKEFTASEWASIHQVSDRTARRQIQSLVLEKKIKPLIRGPKTKYIII